MQHPTKSSTAFGEDQALYHHTLVGLNVLELKRFNANTITPMYGILVNVKCFPAKHGRYPSKAHHSNDQDLPKRSSDDTKNKVCDQVPTEENCNNTEAKDILRRSTQKNKGLPLL